MFLDLVQVFLFILFLCYYRKYFSFLCLILENALFQTFAAWLYCPILFPMKPIYHKCHQRNRSTHYGSYSSKLQLEVIFAITPTTHTFLNLCTRISRDKINLILLFDKSCYWWKHRTKTDYRVGLFVQLSWTNRCQRVPQNMKNYAPQKIVLFKTFFFVP